MNTPKATLATTLCRDLHSAEWTAPYPRTIACRPCHLLAGRLVDAGWRKS